MKNEGSLMTTPKSLLDAGDLKAAIEELTREVRAEPGNLQKRTFLFELLSFAGEWDRAEKQLSALPLDNPQSQLAAQIYKGNFAAERTRAKVFAGQARPGFLRPAPAYVDLHVQALGALGRGSFAEARELLDRAEEERPALPGKAAGKPFADFRDFDDRTAPVLELIHKGSYVWMPLEQLRRIEVTPPKKLRDLLWPGAVVEADDGTTGDVFLFALYAGSGSHADDKVRLGRMTEWLTLADDVQVPAGLRCFLVDEDDRGLFEAGRIELDAREAPQS